MNFGSNFWNLKKSKPRISIWTIRSRVKNLPPIGKGKYDGNTMEISPPSSGEIFHRTNEVYSVRRSRTYFAEGIFQQAKRVLSRDQRELISPNEVRYISPKAYFHFISRSVFQPLKEAVSHEALRVYFAEQREAYFVRCSRTYFNERSELFFRQRRISIIFRKAYFYL